MKAIKYTAQQNKSTTLAWALFRRYSRTIDFSGKILNEAAYNTKQKIRKSIKRKKKRFLSALQRPNHVYVNNFMRKLPKTKIQFVLPQK